MVTRFFVETRPRKVMQCGEMNSSNKSCLRWQFLTNSFPQTTRGTQSMESIIQLRYTQLGQSIFSDTAVIRWDIFNKHSCHEVSQSLYSFDWLLSYFWLITKSKNARSRIFVFLTWPTSQSLSPIGVARWWNKWIKRKQIESGCSLVDGDESEQAFNSKKKKGKKTKFSYFITLGGRGWFFIVENKSSNL